MKIEPSKDLKDKVVDLCITLNKINRNKIVGADIRFVVNPKAVPEKTLRVTIMEEVAEHDVVKHILLISSHIYEEFRKEKR